MIASPGMASAPAISVKRLVQSSPLRVKTFFLPRLRWTRAAYYGGPSAAWGGVSSGDRAQYIKNLHDSGYNPKDNFNANGTIKVQ